MRTEIEIQQEKVNGLIKLMKENPTLEVIPKVDTDVVGGDDYAYWTGVFGEAEIDETWSDDERIYFKSVDEEDLIEMALEGMNYNPMLKDKTVEELRSMAEDEISKLEWERVITVDINTH